jgi:endonuclease YncB( thermonuclease family)
VLLGLLLACSADASADTLLGRVVRVVDGDTLVVLRSGKVQERVRLAGIDCPERGQAFGTKAKEELLARVGGDDVRIEWEKRDRYGRIVGKVVDPEGDVNLALVRSGMCWWYRRYAEDQSAVDRVLYEKAEDAARGEGLGLWRDPAPVPPWEWRHAAPTPAAAASPPRSARDTALTCHGKRACRDMADCAEARFYFERCGLSTLDGNGDGTPCDALCR